MLQATQHVQLRVKREELPGPSFGKDLIHSTSGTPGLSCECLAVRPPEALTTTPTPASSSGKVQPLHFLGLIGKVSCVGSQ
jgi:hypothetical protein